MLTHPLPLFVESPEGLGQDILINRSANVPGAGSSMTPHSTASQKDVLQTGGSPLHSCMFCDETLTQEDLGPHVLTQHPTTVFEPTVLCIEAEFRIPAERARPKPVVLPLEKEVVFSCVVCGQVSQDASELETHMRKHKDYFTYGCNVCGRRFKESWFLKSHMKKHGTKPGARSKIQQDHETPVAVNGVIQDQTPEPVATVYKMCMVCGFFFPDQESLVEHSKVHNREIEPRNDEENQDASAESLGDQNTFLHNLNLRPRCDRDNMQPERASRSIAQLDPFTTYQAWQLATKGKVAVGPNNAKDLGQDASTDNEESGSDKEELSNIWSEGQGDKPVREALGRELRSQQQTAMESPSPEPDQKSLIRKDKDRPTHCEDCGRTFRTYHQLVLHSRVHKKERTGEESPTASTDGKVSRPGSLDRAEEGIEDCFEDRTGAETLGSDGAERSKVKGIVLRECSYCGKAFRSSYYLNVHLRVHTGEKPFKCVYCDYAAAQKTSLKYHLERRHKDKSSTDIPSQPLPFMPSPDEKEPLNNNKKTASSRSKLWVPGPRSGASGNPEDRFNSIGGKLAKPLAQLNAEYEKVIAKTAYSPADDVHIKCPMPVNLKMERKEIKEESFEAPLNLSLKVSLSISPSPEPRNVSIPIACSSCTYKTLYPEVLVMHMKLIHKDKSDMTKKNGFRGSLKRNRSTNCPPALNGKDVTPLSMIDRRHPRRTKSPTREPTKSQEKDPSSNQPPTPKQSPIRVPRSGAVQETRQYKTGTEPHVNHGSSRFPESVKESSSRYLMGRLGPTDRVGIGEMSYAVRGGVSWPAYAAGLSLSSRFENLPHMDLGEPSIKRLKYSMPPGMETDTFDKPGFRVPTKDGSNRMLIRITPSPQGSFPAKIPEVFGPGKAMNSPTASTIDRDWNMMNILRSYSPSDLASFYQGSSANASHGGLPNPRAGNRPTLYQQLPALPNLTMRDHSGTDVNESQGTTDKTT